MNKPTINSLQVFRGCAALAVVALHATVASAAFAATPAAAAPRFGPGFLGVDFFFVLSGFIITYAHLGDAHSIASVRRYALRRLLRIFPAYLPVSVAMLLLYGLLPGFSAQADRKISLLTSLLLLPADAEPALGVAWTLVHELLFYLVFATCFVSPRLLALSLGVWALLIAACAPAFSLAEWTRYPLSPLNLEFMLGVAAAWQVRSAARRPGSRLLPRIQLAAGALLAVAALRFHPGQETYVLRLVFAGGLSLVVTGLSLIELSAPIRWPAALLLVGDASYSIYLVHNPVLSVLARITGRIDAHWTIALCVNVVVAVGAGLIWYRLAEKPALDFSRRWTRRNRNTAGLE